MLAASALRLAAAEGPGDVVGVADGLHRVVGWARVARVLFTSVAAGLDTGEESGREEGEDGLGMHGERWGV